jgi:DNA-binding transcriptional LysR family regulator
VQVNSFEALCLMAAAGVGVGVVPQSAAARYGRAMEIAVVPLTDAWAERRRYVVTPEGATLGSAVLDLVEAICAPLSS